MGSGRRSFFLIQIVLLIMFLGGILHHGLPAPRGEHLLPESGGNYLMPATSIIPSSPEILEDDTADFEAYGINNDYYYKTNETATPSYYQVFWVQPTDPSDYFRLFVYPDDTYSVSIISTLFVGIDWVVIRPSSPQYLYPMVHTYNTGDAYIEWEVSTASLSSGVNVSGYLDVSEYIDTYNLSLSESRSYKINLTVPDTADFDFFIYYLDPGEASNGADDLRNGDTVGTGVDEVIRGWVPSITGECVLLVVRQSGSGTYTLTLTSSEPESSPIPLNQTCLFLGVMSAILIVAMKKKNLGKSRCQQ